MSIKVSFLNIQGSPLRGENPLPLYRARIHDTHPSSNGTLRDEEFERFGVDTAFRILPYRMQDRYDRKKEAMELVCITLENELVKAQFLPEYGGRLYSLVNKKTGRELLYRNPVMQPANLAIRNAWFSGGIEWNVAQLGHTFTTCDKVFFAKVVDEKGYEFLRLYDYERTKGLLWQVDFHLPEGSQELTAHVSIINDTHEDVSMYWWTNIAVKEGNGCRIFSATKDVIYIEPKSLEGNKEHSFGHAQLPDLPVVPGKDASYPESFHFASEYFFQNSKEEISPWEAVSYDDGFVFYERSTQPLRTRKMFCWGTHKGGRQWRDYLSVPGKGNYVEIQAGLAPTQLHTTVLEAGKSVSFTQCFGCLEVDAGDVLADNYDVAQMCIRTAVNNQLSVKKMLEIDEKYSAMRQLPCSRVLHAGHGWGALEQIRRMVENQPLFPQQFMFPAETIGEEQQIYLRLIMEHCLPPLQKDRFPSAMLVDPAYKKYLEKCLMRNSQDATAHLLLGGILYENGEDEMAIAHWKKGLQSVDAPILWRNLAYAKAQNAKYEKAASYMERAHLETYEEIDFAFYDEYFTYLLKLERFEEVWNRYNRLSARLKEEEGLYVKACCAAIELDEFDFLEKAFEREYALIREGEVVMSDIWFAYAKKKGLPETAIPKHLDMRLKG